MVTGPDNNTVLQRFKLTNRVALVTGAGQGIGRALAHALGEAGAAVAVVDLQLDTAREVVGELAAKGVRGVAIQADVRMPDDCQRCDGDHMFAPMTTSRSMVRQTVSMLGGLHIAVNNAGVNVNSAAEDTSVEEWDGTFAVNTRGVFLCCQAQGRHMLAEGGGSIINIAYVWSLAVGKPLLMKTTVSGRWRACWCRTPRSRRRTTAARLPWSSSRNRAGMDVRCVSAHEPHRLAAEWAGRGVRVNAVSPGIVDTALIRVRRVRLRHACCDLMHRTRQTWRRWCRSGWDRSPPGAWPT